MHEPTIEETTDPAARSWVPTPPDGAFPVQNLPLGVFRRDGEPPRVGVAIGSAVLDLAALANEGLLHVDGAAALFHSDTLHPFLGAGRATWQALRRQVFALLSEQDRTIRDAGRAERLLVEQSAVELLAPVRPGDYVDFYASEEHATNLGRMFRPDADPLLPNWKHLPVGYHGRSSTVVASGTPIVRPCGQRRPGGDGPPPFGPSRRLDFELEVGFVAGPGNRLGEPIPAGAVEEHVFGLVLVNDWSARDIQAWEYQPLGPFLGKSFATSLSPWVVPLDALAPFRVPGPVQDPPPLDYLRVAGDWAYDLELEVLLAPRDGVPTRVSHTNFRRMYWTIPQMLAHATVNGAVVRPGDLFASGTVSGDRPGTFGSLIELSWGGSEPVALGGGTSRTFLEDGDTVTMTGWAAGDGWPRIGFGAVTGTVEPARC